MQKVFLIDFDYTLSDTTKVKEDIGKFIRTKLGIKTSDKFWEYYETFRNEKGKIYITEILEKFSELYLSEPLTTKDVLRALGKDMHLYPNVNEALKELSKQGSVYIYTEGASDFQIQKVKQSGVERFVRDIYCMRDKEITFDSILNSFKGSKVIYVEDNPKYLLMAKAKHPQVITVFVRQGYYSDKVTQEDLPKFDFVIQNIGDIRKLSFDE